MNEYEIKRFGEITVLEVNPIIEGGYVRICNEDDFINNIIITIEEIRSISMLYHLLGYSFIETLNNSLCYKDGYLEIENAFGSMIFNKTDVDDLSNYLYEVYENVE